MVACGYLSLTKIERSTFAVRHFTNNDSVFKKYMHIQQLWGWEVAVWILVSERRVAWSVFWMVNVTKRFSFPITTIQHFSAQNANSTCSNCKVSYMLKRGDPKNE